MSPVDLLFLYKRLLHSVKINIQKQFDTITVHIDSRKRPNELNFLMSVTIRSLNDQQILLVKTKSRTNYG